MKYNFSKKSVFGTLFSNLFIQVITILQGILIARFLGPDGRGAFAAILLWPSFFAGIFVFGTKTGIGIIAAKERENLGGFYFPSLAVALITGLMGWLVTYFSIPILLGDKGSYLIYITRIYSFVVIINHFAGVLLAIDHGSGNFKRYNLLRVLLNPIYFVLLFWLLISNNLTLENCVKSLLLANFIVLIIRFLLIVNKINLKNRYSIIKIFRKSLSFGLADLAIPLYEYLDKAILLWLLGTINLGYYTVALTAAGVLGVLAQTIGTVSFTQLAIDADSSKKVIKIFKLTCVSYMFLGFMLAIMLPILIPLVYGNDFKPAVFPGVLLILATFFQGQGYILEQAIRGAGKAFVGLEGRLFSIFIMICFGFLFSQWFGLIGVVIAFILAQFTFFIIIAFRYNKYFKLESSLIPQKEDIKQIVDFLKKQMVLNK